MSVLQNTRNVIRFAVHFGPTWPTYACPSYAWTGVTEQNWLIMCCPAVSDRRGNFPSLH